MTQYSMGANRSKPVAAIDFGTSYAGYAYSFQCDEGAIFTGKDDFTYQKDRVPTTVLLNPDQSFHLFGFKAEDDYSVLSDNDQQRFYYFKAFKMVLYTQETLTRHTIVKDERGKPMKAMALFQMVIHYLVTQIHYIISEQDTTSVDPFMPSDLDLHCSHTPKHKAMDSMKRRIIQTVSSSLVVDDIHWMITIPAIWTDHARQFMREAALAAGINRERLHLVLEPEAASLYCLHQLSKVANHTHQLPVGFKYILADLGGGTADICVHEVIEGGKLRELHRATGDNLGGTRVDFEFVNFMIEMVGKELWTEFEEHYTSCYLKFMKNFTEEKKKFSTASQQIVLTLEYSLIDLLHKDGKTIGEIISSSRFHGNMEFVPDRLQLILKSRVMARFFNPSTEGTINLLMEVLQECSGQNIQTLLLVGGYAESPYLRQTVINAIEPVLKVALEPDARLAVLKGAVMMGYKPQNIIQRRATHTYGFSVSDPFIEGKHSQELKCIRDGEILCTNVFEILIRKDDIIEYGQKLKHGTSNPVRKPESKKKVFHPTLYRSRRKNPKYCVEDDCEVVGTIDIRPPKGGWGYINVVYLDYILIVDELEIYAKVYDKSTNRVFEKRFDLLQPL